METDGQKTISEENKDGTFTGSNKLLINVTKRTSHQLFCCTGVHIYDDKKVSEECIEVTVSCKFRIYMSIYFILMLAYQLYIYMYVVIIINNECRLDYEYV